MDYVFIDASVFIAEHYFKGTKIKTLLNASKRGQISVVLTDLTLFEIKKHLKADVTKQSSKKCLNDLGSGYFGVLNKKLFSQVEEKLHSLYDDSVQYLDKMLTESNVTILPLNPKIDVIGVVEKYKKQEKPFSEKKPKEFPDAFVLETLELWCKQEKKPCVVLLSKDKDFQELSYAHLQYRDFDVYVNDVMDEYKKMVRQHENEIIRHLQEDKDIHSRIGNLIYESFDDSTLYTDLLCIEDINDYDIKILSVYINEQSLVRDGLFDDFVTYYVEADVELEVSVTHPDYDTGYYDNEDGEWMFIDEKAESIMKFELTIPIRFTEDTENNSIELDSIHNNRQISEKEIKMAYIDPFMEH